MLKFSQRCTDNWANERSKNKIAVVTGTRISVAWSPDPGCSSVVPLWSPALMTDPFMFCLNYIIIIIAVVMQTHMIFRALSPNTFSLKENPFFLPNLSQWGTQKMYLTSVFNAWQIVLCSWHRAVALTMSRLILNEILQGSRATERLYLSYKWSSIWVRVECSSSELCVCV